MEKNETPVFDSYKSIAGPSEGLFKDNGSRFISFAYPVETEEEVKSIVGSLKKSTTMQDIIAMPIVSVTKVICFALTMTVSRLLLLVVRFSDRLIPTA